MKKICQNDHKQNKKKKNAKKMEMLNNNNNGINNENGKIEKRYETKQEYYSNVESIQ